MKKLMQTEQIRIENPTILRGKMKALSHASTGIIETSDQNITAPNISGNLWIAIIDALFELDL